MSGLNAKNINNFTAHLCSCCRLILHEPVQLECGDRLCKGCVDAIQEDFVECPMCHEQSRKSSVILDRGCIKDMEKLSTECSSCDWTGEFKDYENHQQTECSAIRTLNTSRESMTVDHILSNQVTIENSDRERLNSTPIDIGQTSPINHTIQATTEENNSELEERGRVLHLLAEHLHGRAADIERFRQFINTVRGFIINTSNALERAWQAQIVQDTTLEAIRINNGIILVEIESLRQQIDERQQVSYDGSLLWKISNVREKMEAAQTGPLCSLDSVPFYSHASGYKLCVRVCLNGHATGRGRYLSLYFFLMRGDFDAILPFPFHFKVIFCLYDQSGENHHIIKCYQPNSSNDDVRRPQFSINLPIGFSRFVSLKYLHQHRDKYLKDNAMFIRFMIDFRGMPDDVIPLVMNLNLALPKELQQQKIEEEIQKRTQ